jgi:hypothetical protein
MNPDLFFCYAKQRDCSLKTKSRGNSTARKMNMPWTFWSAHGSIPIDRSRAQQADRPKEPVKTEEASNSSYTFFHSPASGAAMFDTRFTRLICNYCEVL